MTENQPLVSVIIPVYNCEKYVEETLTSLLSQDYPHLEIIAVNDGSSDNSLEIISKYKDQISIITQENAGQSAALNKGWQIAKGSLLGYLSSDDILYPNAISTLVEALNNNPTASTVYCDYNLIDTTSVAIRAVKAPDFDEKDLIENMICQPGPGALFRKSAFTKAGGWNTQLKQMPDYDFWLRMNRFGPLIHVTKNLAGFRVHEESQTFKKMPYNNSNEPVKVMTEFFESPLGALYSHYQKNSLATAKCLSAQWHLRSGRSLTALKIYTEALLQSPKVFFSRRTIRGLISATIGRVYYRNRFKT